MRKLWIVCGALLLMSCGGRGVPGPDPVAACEQLQAWWAARAQRCDGAVILQQPCEQAVAVRSASSFTRCGELASECGESAAWADCLKQIEYAP